MGTPHLGRPRPPAAKRPAGTSAVLLLLAALPATVLPTAVQGERPASASFVLQQDVVDAAAGETMTSDAFVHDGSLGQPSPVGEIASDTWVVQAGFWTGLSTRRVIRIAGAGSGSGTVTGPGVSCEVTAGAVADDCSQSFLDGEMPSFVAVPDPANAFDAWTGCDRLSTTSLPDDTCEVEIDDGRTITARFTALATVSGRVWRDVDGGGDQDPSEPGFGGVGVTLTDGDGVTLTTTTDGNGNYRFEDVYPGDYEVRIGPLTLPPGTAPSFDPDGVTTPHVTDVGPTDGEALGGIDFGYQPQTNLELTKIDDVADGEILPGGETLTYTITVENLGPGVASDVTVTDSLPAGTTLVETIGCAEDPSAVPTCTLGTLDVGQSASYTIEVSIDPDPPGSITNTASVGSLEVDLDANDNADSESTLLDDLPPRVSVVDTVPTTADGVLAPCETVHGQRTEQLVVTFDEPMANPAGNSASGDVTNPDGWQLVGAGADQDLQTTACGALAGDDRLIAIRSVTYSGQTATLTPAASLGSRLLRLFACGDGERALTDVGGTPLDGDGDGLQGGDFVRLFRTDPGNALGNGHFDCDLRGWEVVPESADAISYADDDRDGSDDSGSAEVTTGSAASGTEFLLGRCAEDLPSGEGPLELSAWLRLDAEGAGAGFELLCTFFDGVSCEGSASSPSGAAGLVSDTGEAWVQFYEPLVRPAGSRSAFCEVGLTEVVPGESFSGHLDRVRLGAPDSPIFGDGFESGDLDAWSTSVP